MIPLNAARSCLLAAALATALATVGTVPAQDARPAASAREDAYRANNLGVARLEQFNFAGAAEAFRDAMRLDPSVALARVNLAIALLYTPDLDAAEREATEAGRLLPRDPRPAYILGLIARARGLEDQARTAFDRVVAMDPRDVGTRVNLGQIDLQQRRYAEAIDQFRAALADEPFSVTASYNLGLALTRAGRRDEGQQAMERSQAMRAGGYGIIFSNNYLEQGRYAEAIASTGAEPELVDRAVPDVTLTREGSVPGSRDGDVIGGGITLIDFDGDGDLDVLAVWPGGMRMLENDRGTFKDRTAGSRQSAEPLAGTGAVAGDYDNDGRPDVLLLRSSGTLLLHNDGAGLFSNATARAGLASYPGRPATAAFVDFDHDGDLDLVIGGDAVLQFARNNGNGTFTDITSQTDVSGASHAIAVVPTDFDNHREIDLLVVKRDGPPALLKNLRDGTFRDVAADVGLTIEGRVTAVAAADINKDDFPDFFFARAGAPGVFASSDGRGRFTIVAAPAATANAVAAQFFDYDNDGLLDLLTWSGEGPRLFRQLSDGWMDVTSRAFPAQNARTESAIDTAARSLALADIDGDGDIDIVSSRPGGGVDVWRNNGGSRNPSVRVRLTGRVSNRSGAGAKIDVRAGSLRQRLETSAATPANGPADVVFGLGRRARADVVRVLWPSGILQAETSVASLVAITELDRKPSSCPFLYTWNGTRFEFVTDFMGGGEMGYWEAPGVRNTPDSDEYVRIRGDQLQARDGRYDLRVTNELEETLYVDRLELLAVTHPDDVEIFPDEGMTDPPKPFRVYAARDLRPPARAVDEHGHDVTDQIARLDRRYPDDFELSRFRGYAGAHALTLTLAASTEPTLLLLTGWTDYAFSSDNVAAHQAGLALQPPRLEVRDAGGAWRTLVADIGVPVGRPQTIVVDLGARLPSAEVRIVTNMRIYWDRILAATRAPRDGVRIDRLDPMRAQLRWRGYSAVLLPDGRQPETYDYTRVESESPWKTMPGRYTREGDVRPLLTRVDDQFVVSRPGDEIAVSFDATRIRPVQPGSTRTFLLFADGFSKEMDINSASPDQVEPLPFHGMTRYPYPPFDRAQGRPFDGAQGRPFDGAQGRPQRYPDTPALRRYRAEYNTRIVAVPLPALDRAVEHR